MYIFSILKKKENWNVFHSYSTTGENQILDLLESCTQTKCLQECTYDLKELIFFYCRKINPFEKEWFS